MQKAKQTKRIVILMPLVWAIRNVIHSGVLDYLSTNGIEVVLLFHKYDDLYAEDSTQWAFQQAVHCKSLLSPSRKRRLKGMALLKQIIGNAFSRRNSIGSYAIYQRGFGRMAGGRKKHRDSVIATLGHLAQSGFAFHGLCRLYNWLYGLEYDLLSIQNQLSVLKPDMVLSTVNVEDTYERAYVLSAKKLNIPVVNSILSFDNLTTKPTHLIYDYYLVWNQGMMEQLLRFYPQVFPEQVAITGTPQFDFHRQAEFIWTRAHTMKNLGLPPEVKYILYGASTKSLAPEEPELVRCLLERMQKTPSLRDFWLVVRPHPRDEWSRWDAVIESSHKVILSNSWERILDFRNGWAMPIKDDYARLTSSLAHAEACINIASTMTLDAAILDRPIIGIRFEHEPDAPQNILYEEYDTDHYRPLVESGGLRLAHNWDELLTLMQQAIEDPGRDADARARMVAQECGVVDGNAARRVADALINYMESIR